jgi:hypothetical protein
VEAELLYCPVNVDIAFALVVSVAPLEPLWSVVLIGLVGPVSPTLELEAVPVEPLDVYVVDWTLMVPAIRSRVTKTE